MSCKEMTSILRSSMSSLNIAKKYGETEARITLWQLIISSPTDKVTSHSWTFCLMRLIALNDAMQWPGFWWCACGKTSSLNALTGLKSLGVCVELLQLFSVPDVAISTRTLSVFTGDELDFTGKNMSLVATRLLPSIVWRRWWQQILRALLLIVFLKEIMMFKRPGLTLAAFSLTTTFFKISSLMFAAVTVEILSELVDSMFEAWMSLSLPCTWGEVSKKLCQQNTTDHDECINEIDIQLNVCSKNIVTAVFVHVIQCFKVQLFFAVCCKFDCHYMELWAILMLICYCLCCFMRWFCNVDFCLYDFPHLLHLNLLNCKWVFMWRTKCWKDWLKLRFYL